MPIPKPSKDAKNKEKFLDRCLSDPVMNKDYPDNAQRFAICNSQWSRRSKMKGSADWEDCSKNGIVALL